MNFSNSQGVKAELSPNYQIPELVSLPYEYVATNDTILNDNECDFQYEIKYLEDYKKCKEEEEEKRKQELKTKAPGLTDKVLEPVRLNSQDSTININKDNENNANNINNNTINNDATSSVANQNKNDNKANIVSEFEDVPPLDPWDKSKTNTDELLQLQMEMNDMSYSQTNNNIKNDNTTNTLNNNPLPQNNTNIPPPNNLDNTTPSPSLSAQSSNMSYTSPYQPPVQPGINTSPGYPPMNQNYRPPPPVSHQMFPYPPYGATQFGSPNTNANEPPPTNYMQGMPQPFYNNRPYSNATPPPIPSRPNPQDYNSPSPSNRNDIIVNSVVDMGFKRELVLNGMKNYGNDKQKVIDYVMLYSYLEGRGYQPKHIDTAIFLYSFNREKCEKFLSAFMELSEMGFDQEEIKEALIFSENDREAAIDHLTKST
ncbi:hypothetical protein PIROE2DRAFT_10874 [Piromyces sp. E2]|nr:hypothetical protein PIROE2DRAFT_10874 [Piromyces sp. E2]|eukprot:OUM62773.1 hypothetical protein PIROE2DRAFT_10874 [Piromyces sp. E2]